CWTHRPGARAPPSIAVQSSRLNPTPAPRPICPGGTPSRSAAGPAGQVLGSALDSSSPIVPVLIVLFESTGSQTDDRASHRALRPATDVGATPPLGGHRCDGARGDRRSGGGGHRLPPAGQPRRGRRAQRLPGARRPDGGGD